jgi:hypothetical protein
VTQTDLQTETTRALAHATGVNEAMERYLSDAADRCVALRAEELRENDPEAVAFHDGQENGYRAALAELRRLMGGGVG